MERSKNYIADFLDGIPYKISQEETHVFYKNEWREIQTDQEGDFYIFLPDPDRAVYFQIKKQINCVSDILKIRDHYKEYLYFAIMEGATVLRFKQWFKLCWQTEIDQETGETFEYLQP